VNPTPTYQPAPVTAVTARSAAPDTQQPAIEYHLQQLASPDERVRAESVMQLGKLKADRAIDPLAATLSGDRSATVRECAARALGLIGSPAALTALQHAAQSDSDHDVRRSAQFAAEVIQSR
jgi:HEAT repeat protein